MRAQHFSAPMSAILGQAEYARSSSVRPRERGRDTSLLSVSCSGHPGAPGCVWLCLSPAKLELIEFLHGAAEVPSACGVGRRAVAQPLVKRKTSEIRSYAKSCFLRKFKLDQFGHEGRIGQRNSRHCNF